MLETLLGLIVIPIFSIFHFDTTSLAEKLFLEMHTNILAQNILETKIEKTYYDYYLLGRIYFVEGKLEKSIEKYSKSIFLNPNFKESFYGRGLSYGFSGEKYFKNSENDFLKYIEIENAEFAKSKRRAYGAWAGYNDLAWIFFRQGEFVKSENAARVGLLISPDSPWLLNSLGVALKAQQKCVEAKKYLELAKEKMELTSLDEFGEAYSGDEDGLLPMAKKNMEETIVENLEACKPKS